MLAGLGANALWKLARGGKLHVHQHLHSGHTHFHPHLHDRDDGQMQHGESHHAFRISRRPLSIGMIHGFAGSAALMLLVLSTIESRALGLLYILVFGVGSVGGMMLMSLILSLPFHFTTDRFKRLNWLTRIVAGGFSLGFGVLIIVEKGSALMN